MPGRCGRRRVCSRAPCGSLENSAFAVCGVTISLAFPDGTRVSSDRWGRRLQISTRHPADGRAAARRWNLRQSGARTPSEIRKATGYLEFLLRQSGREDLYHHAVDPAHRDATSIRVKDADKSLFNAVGERGFFADWREPEFIRIAPVPLYNSFPRYLRSRDLKNC